MEKLLIFEVAKYEFTDFALVTLKNEMAVHALEHRLNVMTEAINELIDKINDSSDKNSNVDLNAFKSTFLEELATMLNQTSEFDFSNSLFDLLRTERSDLQDSLSSLELRLQTLAERVSKTESLLSHEKVEEPKKPKGFNLLNRD